MIEKGEYDAKSFLDEMKEMVTQLVSEVKRENYKTIEIEQDAPTKEKSKTQNSIPIAIGTKTAKKNTDKLKVESNDVHTVVCPKCKKGTILKGRTAYGCSNYKNGCDFLVPFDKFDTSLSSEQILIRIEKGEF